MSARFEIEELGISGVRLVRRKPIGDERGFLTRLFCIDEFADAGWRKPVAQINQTFTKETGTIRGLHFQRPPRSEAKLVTCLKGSIFDVAVDLREGSSTLAASCSAILSAENQCALLIPEGCAHGFQTLSEDVELLYLHSDVYDPACEGGFSPFDPQLGIKWPMPITRISDKDLGHPDMPNAFRGLPFAMPPL